jgi:hypothetical protein
MKSLGHPQHCDSNNKGRRGEAYLDFFVSKHLGWIYRPTNQDGDFGVDAFIDIVDDSNVTGLTIAVQVKCGKSFFNSKSSGGLTYKGQNKHLNYYINIGCPVLLVVLDEDPEVGFWVEFDISKTEETGNGWR